MRQVVAGLCLVLLVSCEDPVALNSATKAEKKKCTACELEATAKHACGTTAYCEKCLGDATREKKVYVESAYDVAKDTSIATCKACKSILGQKKK
jgi:hypothetical protein